MSVVIRAATIQDAESIAAVHVAAWRVAYQGIIPDGFLDALSVERSTRDWRKSLHTKKPDMLVACDGNVIVGWIAFGACRDSGEDRNRAEIEALYVLEPFWRTGVGKGLYNAASQLLLAAGYSSISLWVLSKNLSAQAFYLRIGFTQDARSKTIQIGGASLTEVRFQSLLERN